MCGQEAMQTEHEALGLGLTLGEFINSSTSYR